MMTIPNKESEQALSKLILEGDLSRLTPTEKVVYYKTICDSQGLNPLTQPFSFIRMQGKEILYANKSGCEQLRNVHGISIKISSRDKIEDLYVVTAEAINKSGRQDSSTGAMNLKSLSGEALANALMKAETKSKRRVTLSICGLGLLDASEADSIEGAKRVRVDCETGEYLDPQAPKIEYEQPEAPAEPLKISLDQITLINDLIKELNYEESKIKQHFEVSNWESCTSSMGSRIIAALEKKRGAK